MIHRGTPTVHYSGIHFSSSLSHSTYQKGINKTIRAWGLKEKGKLAKSHAGNGVSLQMSKSVVTAAQ